MQSRCSAIAGAFVLLLVVSCATPAVREDTPLACSNERDDDDNGLVDCDDRACVASEACETSGTTCTDGVDNDRDGLVDCAEESCVALGVCASFSAPCDALARTGCPPGMACYPESEATAPGRVCARTGSNAEGSECAASPNDPSGGCRAGLVCAGMGLCVFPCTDVSGCPRGSFCIKLPDALGICSVTCYPALSCGDGYSCVAAQRLGFPYLGGGYMHACFGARATEGSAATGTAKVGDPCIDGAVTNSPPDEVCAEGALCVPGPDGATCRDVCLAGNRGEDTTNCAQGRCVAADPFDDRPPRPNEPYRYGVCVP